MKSVLVTLEFLPVLMSSLLRIDVFQSHSSRFLETLKICQTSAKNDLKDLDLARALSWDDVMAEYRNARQKYESKAQGWKGISRKFGRLTGDNALSVIPFLDFIPEGQYRSLFAGLSLIFAVGTVISKTLFAICNENSRLQVG